jgi:hypothetical protein
MDMGKERVKNEPLRYKDGDKWGSSRVLDVERQQTLLREVDELQRRIAQYSNLHCDFHLLSKGFSVLHRLDSLSVTSEEFPFTEKRFQDLREFWHGEQTNENFYRYYGATIKNSYRDIIHAVAHVVSPLHSVSLDHIQQEDFATSSTFSKVFLFHLQEISK